MAKLANALADISLSGSPESQLLQLLSDDKYGTALKLAQRSGHKLVQAYALYRLGKEEDSLSLITGDSSRGGLHLKAQLLYRLERFSEAADVYSQLQAASSSECVDNEAEDIQVNKLALAAWQGIDVEEDAVAGNASHEALFNASLAAATRGDTAAAESLLDRAEAAAEVLGLDEADREYELGPILAQRAHLRGDRALNARVRQMKTDAVTTYLAHTNFVANEAANDYEAAKAYATAKPLKPAQRLFAAQDRAVSFNVLVAKALAGGDIKKEVREYSVRHPGDAERLAVLRGLAYNAATAPELAKLAKGGHPYLAGTAIGRLVSIRAGSHKAALELAQSLPDGATDPAIIGARCALLDSMARGDEAQALLDDAISAADKQNKVELLAGAVRRALASSLPQAAKDGSETAVNKSDRALKLVQELAAIALSHPVAVSARVLLGEENGEQPDESVILPDLSGVDLVALESGTRFPSTSSSRKRTRQPSSKRPAQSDKPAKKPRRLPKGRSAADPVPTTEDPDRWLPLRDRASYKPRKTAGKGSSGHQGGFGSEPQPQTQTPAPTGSTANKKKKKKSGRK
ncbi:Signal recognition particle subunit SRP72 [Savitreella phatthalungensis]